MRRTKWLISIALLLASVLLAAIAISYAPFLNGLFKSASSINESGRATILAGNHHVDVWFQTSFPTSPTVLISARTPTNIDAFVTHVSPTHMRIELGDRLDSSVQFFWSANWSRLEWSFFDDTEAPRFQPVLSQAAGDNLEISITGTSFHKPTELFVRGADVALDEATRRRIVAATNDAYHAELECSFVDRLRLKLKLRARDCPPRPLYERLPVSDLAAVDHWVQVQTHEGSFLVEDSHYHSEASFERATAELAALMQGVSAADLMQHNNEVVDFVDAVQDAGILEADAQLTVIHFDTHSDLRAYAQPLGYQPQEHIGDFLNTLIGRGLISDVYWVMPDWTRHPAYATRFHDPSTANFLGAPYRQAHYVTGPETLNIYAVPSRKEVYFSGPPAHVPANEVRQVRFHKVLLDDLPDFSNINNVYLELDADYWSNVGFRSEMGAGENPTESELAAGLTRVFSTLRTRGVRPELASICLSPRFTANEDRAAIAGVFIDALQKSGVKDFLSGYRHIAAYAHTKNAENLRRDTPLLELFLRFYRLDARNVLSDERIYVEQRDAETIEAISLTQEVMGYTPEQAYALLMYLDRLDGELNGVLNLIDIEYYIALEGSPILPLRFAAVFGDGTMNDN